jgi:predicted SAM-dependent methyltransferase
LIDKYRGQPGVDVDRIEDVDFVWCDGPLSGAVPSELHGTFDAFIASHVIEHTPDLIAFLDSAATLLRATGVVILAVPDKRFCFDYFRPLATTGDVLASHRLRRSRHTKQTIFNHCAYVVSADGTGAWSQHSVQNFAFYHSLESAYSAFLTCGEDDGSPYVDMHAWQFTPASFELLLLELARLKFTDWQVDWIGPAVGCEFHVWLRRGGAAAAAALTEPHLNEQRLALLKRTLVEAKQQIEFLMAQPE